MANIRKIEGKRGVSYKITVTKGRDTTGKQIRHFMTWKPEPGMTARQTEKALQRAAVEFERQIDLGLRPDDRQTFQQYAAYVVECKRQEGAHLRTLDYYKEHLVRINAAIGHLKLQDIRPQHLNLFYANMAETGISGKLRSAYPRPAYKEAVKGLRQADIATAAAVSESTVLHSVTYHVSEESARKLCAAIGMKLENAFDLKDVPCLSPSTIRAYHEIISSVLSIAVREGLIPSNPASRAVPPKVMHKEAEHLEAEDIERILEALETEPLKWQAVIHFLLVSGCRRGEAAALRWEKVDFKTGTVRIDAGLVNHDGKLFYGPTKTNQARNLTLPQETLQLLRRYQFQQVERCLALGDAWQGTESYVFTRDDGAPLSPNAISSWVRSFCIRHNLPRFHPHTLRHSLASLLIESGQDIVSVSKRLGHAKTTTTLNIYAHMLNQADKENSNIIGAIVYKSGAKSGVQ